MVKTIVGDFCRRVDVCELFCQRLARNLLAVAHLQAPERQIGYCTPMKTVAHNKFNNNTWFQSVVDHSC